MRILCLAVLAIASLARAQEAPTHFLVEYELAPGVDITHLSQPQMALVQQHGAHLKKLRDDGVVILGGHTANLQHLRGLAILAAKDVESARTVADEDPAVKAGMMKTSVEAFTLAIPPK